MTRIVEVTKFGISEVFLPGVSLDLLRWQRVQPGQIPYAVKVTHSQVGGDPKVSSDV